MTYEIKYTKKTPGEPFPFSETTVIRTLKSLPSGWQLKDGNGRNIRTFTDVASAMTWIDEERRGV